MTLARATFDADADGMMFPTHMLTWINFSWAGPAWQRTAREACEAVLALYRAKGKPVRVAAWEAKCAELRTGF